MTDVLLTSETFVKSVTGLRDNIAGNYMLPSIREAQELGLAGILGAPLTASLKELVRGRQIDAVGNEHYKELLDRCQYYLAYESAVEVVTKVALKVGNIGVVRATDEHLESADPADVSRLQEHYQSRADGCCLRLQEWLLANEALFPELDECACSRLRANLRSAATCGIWLGGARGRKIGGGRL